MNKAKGKHNEIKQKVVTSLYREQIDFLDEIGKDMFFSGGEKISRGEIISMLVDLLLEYADKIVLKNIRNADDLKKEILRVFKESNSENDFPTTCAILTAEEKNNKTILPDSGYRKGEKCN